MTALPFILATVVVAALALVLRPLLRTYRTTRGTRVVTCPETGGSAAVEVDTLLATFTHASTGRPVLRVAACSHWPERRGCAEACLAEIEAAPADCLARTVLARWYQGKTCVFCEKPFTQVRWGDHTPALLSPTDQLVGWEQVPAETLVDVLGSHRPVCSSCDLAETLRRRYDVPGLGASCREG